MTYGLTFRTTAAPARQPGRQHDPDDHEQVVPQERAVQR